MHTEEQLKDFFVVETTVIKKSTKRHTCCHCGIELIKHRIKIYGFASIESDLSIRILMLCKQCYIKLKPSFRYSSSSSSTPPPSTKKPKQVSSLWRRLLT